MSEYNPATTDWTRPAVAGFTITAGASPLAHVTRGIYVGTTGDITVTLQNGDSLELTNIAAGVVHPLACTHVTAATAGGIVGLY